MTFPQMIEVVPERTIGIAAVEHFDVSKDQSAFTALRGGREYVAPGRYARLKVNGQLWMSDTRMERNSNWGVVHNAHGRVLIAGFGLGMILHPIFAKKSVSHVTVIEKVADVITLIEPTVACSKLTVICADIFEWKPPRTEKFNAIYFDVWAEQSTDTLIEMGRLHRRFAHALDRTDENRWMQSWNRDFLKSELRSERRTAWR